MKVFSTLFAFLLITSSVWSSERTIVTMTTNKPAGQTLRIWVNWNGNGVVTINGNTLTNGLGEPPTIVVPNNQTIELVASGNTQLTALKCFQNELITLDVTNCPALTELDCSDNQLLDLDISSCTALTALSCSNNQLSTLDISQCTDLLGLNCHNNQLTTLNVSNCSKLTFLECFSNQLIALDVTSCPMLIALLCYDNQLTDLNVTNCPALVWMVANDQTITLPITPTFGSELNIINPITYNEEAVINIANATAVNGKITWTGLIGNSGDAHYTFTTNLPAGTDKNSKPFSGTITQPWVVVPPTGIYDSEVLQPLLNVLVYPNPASRGQSLTVRANFPDELLNNATITVINTQGQRISHTTVTGSQTSVQMPETIGTYVIHFENKNGFKRETKIIVK